MLDDVLRSFISVKHSVKHPSVMNNVGFVWTACRTLLDSRTCTRLSLILIWAIRSQNPCRLQCFIKHVLRRWTRLDGPLEWLTESKFRKNIVQLTSSNIVNVVAKRVKHDCFIKQCWMMFYGDVLLAWTGLNVSTKGKQPWNKGLLLTASMTCLFIVGCIVNLQGMEEILECFLNDENPDMTRQIQFIIRQLNTGLVNI